MNEANLSIRFWLDGEEYAARIWRYAPRVGEHVVLGKDILYKITSVCWHADKDLPPTWQAVQIEIEPS